MSAKTHAEIYLDSIRARGLVDDAFALIGDLRGLAAPGSEAWDDASRALDILRKMKTRLSA